MLSRRWLLPVLLSLIAAFPSALSAAPANPAPIATTQPDGTGISVRIIGDEWYHRFESGDGFAIVQDAQDRWVYAALDAGGRYVPTPHVVGAEDGAAVRFRDAVGRHLLETAEEKIHRRELFFGRTLPGILESTAESLAASGSADKALTTLNVPVVLIQYPDFYASQSTTSFTNMMNQVGYNGTGSFQDYFYEVSHANLMVTATIVGWYTAPQNRINYKYGYGTTAEWAMAKGLARSAVDAAQIGGLNWSPFDNDADGGVDVVVVVHQGPGAECGAASYANYTDFVWSHAWFLNDFTSNLAVTYGGKLIDRYIMVPEEDCSGGHADIGIYCHEFGHALGLPDLYDTDYSSAGIGLWGLMAYGSWGGNGTTPQTPVHPCAWSKVQQGWVTPTVVNSNLSGVPIHVGQAYRLWTNGAPGQEYFLVEQRRQAGFDSGLPAGGLAVWHIDEAMRSTQNTDNQNESRKLVDLEEADGLGQLDLSPNHLGDAGDLYPGTTANTLFDGASTPDSRDHAGSATQVSVANVGQISTWMVADLGVTAAAGAPNLVIRDCLTDNGTEPVVTVCPAYFNYSPDIWIDNNDDGIQDAPIPGQINHLYARVWNAGAATTNVNIRFYFLDPSLGGTYGMGSPAAVQIIDAVTGLPQVTLPTVGTLPPTFGGFGHRAYINWLIPNPPMGAPRYNIGVVADNAADPQWSPVPWMENNLATLNYAELSQNLGSAPAKAALDESVFHEDLRVFNPYDLETPLLILVESSDPGWLVLPEPEQEIILPPGGEMILPFDIVRPGPVHRDSTTVTFKLFKLPEMELAGAKTEDIAIDDLPPFQIPDDSWKCEHFQPAGDNLMRPVPTAVLSWEEPELDVGGFPERIRFFEVYGAEDPGLVLGQQPESLLGSTFGDDDPLRPGFQYYIYSDLEMPHFYSVVPVDMAGNRGAMAPVKSPTLPISDVPEVPVARVSPNYPNPFNPQTTVDFTLTRAERVRAAVYDPAGNLVTVLANRLYGPGDWQVSWDGRHQDGRDAASGVYFLKVESISLDASRKMTLVR